MMTQHVKLSILPKLIYKLNAMSIKIPKRDFKEFDTLILKFTWNKKCKNIQGNNGKEKI